MAEQTTRLRFPGDSRFEFAADVSANCRSRANEAVAGSVRGWHGRGFIMPLPSRDIICLRHHARNFKNEAGRRRVGTSHRTNRRAGASARNSNESPSAMSEALGAEEFD